MAPYACTDEATQSEPGFILKTPRTVRPPSAKQNEVNTTATLPFPASGVKCALVLKPLEDGQSPTVSCGENWLKLTKSTAQDGSVSEHEFDSTHFDCVYNGTTSRAQLRSEAIPIVEGVMEGKNAAILAYGQTASGKTYNMEGSLDQRQDWGVVPFVLEEVLKRASRDPDRQFLVSLSCVELYCEQLFDLLAEPARGKPAPLGLKQNAEGHYDIEGMCEEAVVDLSQALKLLATARRRRQTAAHSMNEASSRSFADVMIKVESVHHVGDQKLTRCSHLHLCDLAGSERQKATHTGGQTLREAASINSTLHVLRRVVQRRCEQVARAAKTPDRHLPIMVPYKESKLTKVLAETLSGAGLMLVICCLSQHPDHVNDSISTLQFAQACKSLTAAPKVRYIKDGKIASLADDVKSLECAQALAELERQQQHLRQLQSNVATKDLEIERQKRLMAYLETELVVERSLASGTRTREANLALEFRRSCENIVDATCGLIGVYVTCGAEAVGRILEDVQLPQLQRVLDSELLLGQLDVPLLTRLLKAFLQVNYGVKDCLVRKMAAMFAELQGPKLAACWSNALPFCLAELAANLAGSRDLPLYVQDNFTTTLAAIAKVMARDTCAALDMPTVLSSINAFLEAAQESVSTDMLGYDGNSSARLINRALTAVSALVEKMGQLDPDLSRTPEFQAVAAGLDELNTVRATALTKSTRSGNRYGLTADGAIAGKRSHKSQPGKSGGKIQNEYDSPHASSSSLATPPQVKSARRSPLSYSVVLSPEPSAESGQTSAAACENPQQLRSCNGEQQKIPALRLQVPSTCGPALPSPSCQPVTAGKHTRGEPSKHPFAASPGSPADAVSSPVLATPVRSMATPLPAMGSPELFGQDANEEEGGWLTASKPERDVFDSIMPAMTPPALTASVDARDERQQEVDVQRNVSQQGIQRMRETSSNTPGPAARFRTLSAKSQDHNRPPLSPLQAPNKQRTAATLLHKPVHPQPKAAFPQPRQPGPAKRPTSRFAAAAVRQDKENAPGASQQDKENALLSLRLQEMLDTPLPKPGAPPTPATSLAELRQRFNKTGVVPGKEEAASGPRDGKFLVTPAAPANPLALVRQRQQLSMRSIRDVLLDPSV